MTKVWSCERLQRQSRCSKVLEGLLWLVNQAQARPNLEMRAGAVISAAPGWQAQWPVAGRKITLFILVLVRGKVLNF